MGQLLIASLAALIATAPPATTSPIWTFTAPRDIVFFRLTPLGTLVVSTADGLVGVDPANGAVTWRREDIRGLPGTRFQSVPGSGMALVNVGGATRSGAARIELLDLETGRTRWDSRDLGIGAALGHLFVPHRQLVVMYTAPPAETSLTWRDDKHGPWTFVAVDVARGRLAWVNDYLLRAPPITTLRYGSDGSPVRSLLGTGRGMLFDTESTAVLDISREGPVRLNLVSGERIWPTAPPESLDTRGAPVTAGMAVGDSAVYAARRGRLQALSLADGRLLWERTGNVLDLRMTRHGLLVCSGGASLPEAAARAVAGGIAAAATGVPFLPVGGLLGGTDRHLELLDLRTGELLWKKPYTLPRKPKGSHAKGEFAPFDLLGDTVYVGGDQVLRGIRLPDGAVFELARFGLSEEDWPERLEARPSGVLLRTRVGLISLDPRTEGRYGLFGCTRYSLSPPGLEMPEAAAIGTAILVLGAVAYIVSTALTETRDAYNNAYGSYFGPVAYAASGSRETIVAAGAVGGAIGISAVLNQRRAAIQSADSYAYMLGRVRDARSKAGPGIVRVNKDTGKIESQVMLRYRAASGYAYGDSRPAYEVDDIAGRLYYRSSPRTIGCYPF